METNKAVFVFVELVILTGLAALAVVKVKKFINGYKGRKI